MTRSDASSSLPAAEGERPRQIARALLDIGAVHLQPDDPFTWSSGLLAPIYCDNRITLGYPAVRSLIAEAFTDVMNEHALLPATIAGTATAGIPHAAWLSDRVEAPMCYVRSSSKDHGRRNRIEGVIRDGQPVVVVEDLISTGASALSAAEALTAAGATVAGILAIFTYELDAATQRFEAAGIPLHTLTGFQALLTVATDTGRLDDDQRKTLTAWRRDPAAWSHAAGTDASTDDPADTDASRGDASETGRS